MLFGNTWFVNLYMAPDDGAGAGGASTDVQDATQGGEPDKKFTQADVDKMLEKSMVRWRKGLQKEKETAEAKVDALQKKLEEMQQKMEVATGTKGSEEPTDLAGKIELLQKQHKQQVADFEARLAAEAEARKKAEAKALSTKRNTEIQQALVEAGCRADGLNVAHRAVDPDVEFDEEEERFVYRSPETGTTLPLGDGIKAYLPDYLKQSYVQGSGAGTKGVSKKKEAAMSELETAKKKLADLEKAAQRDPGNREAVNRWMRQRKEVANKEQALQSIS